MEKWVEDLNKHFSKEDKQIANRHLKRCSSSLIIREMQIQIIMRYHFTLIRMAIIKKIYNEQMLEGVWRKGNRSTLLVAMYVGAATMENSMEVPQKNYKERCHMI